MIIVDGGGELRIESVNAFHKQHVVLFKFQRLLFLHPASELKRICGYIDSLSVKQAIKIGIQKIEIKGIKGFKIIIAGFISWSVFTIHEIVVQRNHLWHYKVGGKMNGKSFCGSGFAGG